MEGKIKLKNNVALTYKIFLCVMILLQVVLFFVELFLHHSSWYLLSIVVGGYFYFRLHVFNKLDVLAKKINMSIFDYVKKFEANHNDF